MVLVGGVSWLPLACLPGLAMMLPVIALLRWAGRQLLKINYEYCVHCGYSLVGAVSEHCPECGRSRDGWESHRRTLTVFAEAKAAEKHLRWSPLPPAAKVTLVLLLLAVAVVCSCFWAQTLSGP